MEDEKVQANGHGPDVESEAYLKAFDDRLIYLYARKAADEAFEEDNAETGFDSSVKTELRRMTVRGEAKKIHDAEQAKLALADNPSWLPQDPGPFLRGEVAAVIPTVGAERDDQACSLCYAGKEHGAVGNIESGKTWLMLLNLVAEVRKGNHVIYLHFEESDGAGTFERMCALGLTNEQIEQFVTFVGPTSAPLPGQIESMIRPNTTLAILDGVNEAISLLGGEHFEVSSASGFREKIVNPFLERGIATFSCDHFPTNSDSRRTAAYGSVHKGAVINGARYSVENWSPFGRNMDGCSGVYVTKDRPGRLRQHGHQTSVPGKTLIAVLDIRSAGRPDGSVGVTLRAPSSEEQTASASSGSSSSQAADRDRQSLQATIWSTVYGQPNHQVPGKVRLLGILRTQGVSFSNQRAEEAIGVLLAMTEGSRLEEFDGPRGAKGYRAISFLSAVADTPENEQE